MRNVFGALAVAAVCGVCCAFPLALPVLGSLASSPGIAFGWETAALASVVTLAVTVLFIQRRSRRRTPPASPGGIRQPDGSRQQVSRREGQRGMGAPLACTLPSAQMRERVAAIAGLARCGLLAHQQCGPSLYLRYSSTVAHELERLVAQEQECSPFLDFELTHRVDAIHLIITTPAAAAEFASILTSHFLGKPAQQYGCTPSCGCKPNATA